MPTERKYNQGAIVYFENDPTPELFILKSGRLDISYEDPQSGEKITRTLNQGEFFGLKSAIIGHTRDEMAQAITDCIVVVFNNSEFEQFVAGKVELMKRLLKVLSNQLRNLGIKVNNYLSNNVVYPPNVGMFKIGEYYLNNKKYQQSIQVYQRYIQAYANTQLVEEAKNRIEIAQEAQKTGFLKKFKPVDELVQIDAEGSSLGTADVRPGIDTTPSKLGLKDFMNAYYKAESFVKGEQYAEAAKELQSLSKIDTKMISLGLRHKASFLEIQVLFRLHKFEDCIQKISDFVRTIKDPTMVKNALFVLSAIYAETQNQEGVISILQKIVAMQPIDDLSKKAKAQLDKLKGKA